MKPWFDKATVKHALSAHGAIGLCASALLYLICLTGTVTVFYEEWQRIEQPDALEMHSIGPDAVQAGLARVMEIEKENQKDKPTTTHLFVHMPVDSLPRVTVTTDSQAFHIDDKGAIAQPEENAWADFLLNLHYRLLLPSTLGITIVGALGVMIVALTLSGVIALPRIFRDAFRLRAKNTGGAGLADWHNRLGVWTLPFALAVALTGAMIGLGSVNGYGLATSFYKGDLEAVYAPIFGDDPAGGKDPAPLPDIARALREMATRFPDVKPTFVVIHEPLTTGQHVQVVATHARRLILGEYYNFDTHGTFLGTTGLADGAVGQQMAASTYNLHFGNYGGLPVKIAYFVLGLALCVVIATGVSIWLGKRARQGKSHPRIASLWDGIVWGLPVALTLTFLARLMIGNTAPLAAIFWGSSALILLAAGCAGPQRQLKPSMQIMLNVGLAISGLTAFFS